MPIIRIIPRVSQNGLKGDNIPYTPMRFLRAKVGSSLGILRKRVSYNPIGIPEYGVYGNLIVIYPKPDSICLRGTKDKSCFESEHERAFLAVHVIAHTN